MGERNQGPVRETAEMAPHIDGLGGHVMNEGFRRLDMRYGHGARGGLLERKAGDPFDRIRAARWPIEDLTLVMRDREFIGSGCKVIW